MKKILSLLLVCTMIFSLAAISGVSADASATYNFKAAAVKAVKQGFKTVLGFDTAATEYGTVTKYSADMSTETATQTIAIEVSTTIDTNAGHIALAYDKNVVVPAAVMYNEGVIIGQQYDEATGFDNNKGACLQFANSTSLTNDSSYVVDDSKVAFTWYTTGTVSANSPIAYITFFVKDGKTTADFDKNTFTVLEDVSSVPNEAIPTEAKNNYSSLYLYDLANSKGIGLLKGDVNASFTYPNSDKGDEPGPSAWTTTTDATEAGFNTAQDIQFRTETAKDASDAANGNSADIKRKVVIFAKNTTGNTLDPQTYGIQIGNAFYPGVGAVSADQYWAIILVDTTDSKLTVGTTYDYSAKINGTEIGTGTATVQ